LKAGVLDEPEATGGRQPYLAYLTGFWSPEGQYAADKAAQGEPLSTYYVKMSGDVIRRHIAPYTPFKRLTLETVTTDDLERWRTWARREHGLSIRMSNICLQAQSVALGEAWRRGVIRDNPASRVKMATDPCPVKGNRRETQRGGAEAVLRTGGERRPGRTD